MEKEKVKLNFESNLEFQNKELAMQTENEELRKLIGYYKTQYRNRQGELTQLLDENSKLYRQIQGYIYKFFFN